MSNLRKHIFMLLILLAPLQVALPKANIIFDTDMGSDCDDTGALAVLHALADKGLAEILACMYSSGKAIYGPGCIDAINTYYGRPDIPIGAYFGSDVGDPRDPFAKKIAQDTLTYKHNIVDRTQVPDLVALYRQTLSTQLDNSVTIVSVGHLKGLYDLLSSPADQFSSLSGRELVARKVNLWVCMGGRYPTCGASPEWNFSGNGSAPFTQFVVDNWPTRCVFSGGEIGERIITGKQLTQVPDTDPVKKAYQLFVGNLRNGRPSWDLTAVLYAVRGLSVYWDSQSVGYNRLSETGANVWEVSPDKEHEYLIEKAPVTFMQDVLDSLMIASPALSGVRYNRNDGDQALPKTIFLGQNYPNPFNGATSVPFSLSKPADVEMNIYDSLGHKVFDLVKNNYQPGVYHVTWDGTDNSANLLSSGIYFLSLKTSFENEVIKLILLQ